MQHKLAFVFLPMAFCLTLSQSTVDICPAKIADAPNQGITASIEDLVSGAVFLESNHPCGGGLWKRVGNLNMSDDSNECPDGWREHKQPVRSCGRPDGSVGGCLPTTIKTESFEYSHVCGRIIGYQVNTPDAFNPRPDNIVRDIDDIYVDGLSLTHGMNPRKHIWTFAAGSNEFGDDYGCSCGTASYVPTPYDFVNKNYFCESARNETEGFDNNTGFLAEDPLWDGKGCPTDSNCCNLNSPPWFIAELDSSTSDDIVIRLCMDQQENDEDVAIEEWEIYVQ